jgi:hypothetical protein
MDLICLIKTLMMWLPIELGICLNIVNFHYVEPRSMSRVHSNVRWLLFVGHVSYIVYSILVLLTTLNVMTVVDSDIGSTLHSRINNLPSNWQTHSSH